MDTHINDEIYEMLEKDKRGSATRPPFEKILQNVEFDNNMAKYYDIRKKILSDIKYVEMLLVIGFKKITWRKELQDKFDIHPGKITEFFDYMKQQGMILFKSLTDIDNSLFETVLSLNTNMFYSQREFVKVYTLSPEGNEITKKLMNDINKLKEKRTDLKTTIEAITEKTNLFKLQFKKINNNEYDIYINDRQITLPKETQNLNDQNKKYLQQLKKRIDQGKYKLSAKRKNNNSNFYCKDGERLINYPDGTKIIKKTEWKKQQQKELKLTLQEIKIEQLEQKKNQGLITKKESNQLLIIKKNPLSIITLEQDKQIIFKNQINYNGTYSNLTTSELIRESERSVFKINSRDNKKIEKESYNGIVDENKIIELEEHTSRIKLKGYHNETDFKDYSTINKIKIDQTAEGFLDSLIGV